MKVKGGSCSFYISLTTRKGVCKVITEPVDMDEDGTFSFFACLVQFLNIFTRKGGIIRSSCQTFEYSRKEG